MQNRDLIIATVKENVSLSVFDAHTGDVVAAVPVGTKDIAKPHEIAVTNDGRYAFVSLYGDKDYGPNTIRRQGLRTQHARQPAWHRRSVGFQLRGTHGPRAV